MVIFLYMVTYTIMVIFLYNLFMFVWIQLSCLANTVLAFDPTNSFLDRLWCIAYLQTEHILNVLKRHEAENKDVDVSLQYNAGSQQQMKYWLDRKTRGINCYYRPQRGNNLGEKLMSAISDSFGRGHQYVVVIGKWSNMFC